jgi:hypothetical protein
MNRWTLALALVIFMPALAVDSSQNGGTPPQVQDPHPTPPQDSVTAPERITLPPGTVIEVRVADAVNSNHNKTGDLLTGIVDPSVLIEDRVVIPRGTEAHVRMVDDKKGGHIHGKAEVRLELVGLVLNGQKLGVDSSTYKKDQGQIAGKVKAADKPAAGAGADAALAAGPTGSAAAPVIAIFSAPKVELKPNSRISFKLTEPFSFDKPPIPAAASNF